MYIDELRKQIPNESSCRRFFVKLIWSKGRFCPHCQNAHSYKLRGDSCRNGLLLSSGLFETTIGK